MLIHVDTLSPEPIFEQIAYQVRTAVARGDLRHGDKLQSVRELAKTAGVNPNTVVKAYDVLQRDGIIVRKQGAGCFVTESASGLKETERRRQLRELTERLVTDAFHLGFEPGQVRDELNAALKRQRESQKRRSK